MKEAIDAARLCAAKISNEAERLAMTAALNDVQNASRSDSGKPHRRTPRGWRRQEDVAADFSKQTKKIGGKSYGGVTVERVKDWERRFPNETKREPKSGYHAGLRNTANPTPEIKRDYFNAAANWNEYWRLHNEAFPAWLEENPGGSHSDFLKIWERPGKTVHRNDTDKTMRYGADTQFIDSLDDGAMDGGED